MIKKAGVDAPAFFCLYFWCAMKKTFSVLLLAGVLNVFPMDANAQCSVCTRTTEQLGEKPAGKINAGILYLAATPLAIGGILGYRWWKKNGE